MFENVDPTIHINPTNKEEVTIKAIQFKRNRTTEKKVNSTAKEIDIIALENFGDVNSIMDIVLHNSAMLVDYNFNFDKISTMEIPNL